MVLRCWTWTASRLGLCESVRETRKLPIETSRDDHLTVLTGLCAALQEAPDIAVLACAARGNEALELVQTLPPGYSLLPGAKI